MKNWICIILIAFLSYGCGKRCNEGFGKFMLFLEPEEATMLAVLNHSFDTLLQSIYPNIPEYQDRLSLFLEDYSEKNDFYSQFPFIGQFPSDSLSFRKLKSQLESSGLRKDVYIYENEYEDVNYEEKYDLNEWIPEDDEPEPVDLGQQLDIDLIEAEIHAKNQAKGYEIHEYDQESIYLYQSRPELDFYMNPHGKFWYGLGKYSCNADIIGILESVKKLNRISLAVVAGGMKETDLNDPFIRQAVMAQFYIPTILRIGYVDEKK